MLWLRLSLFRVTNFLNTNKIMLQANELRKFNLVEFKNKIATIECIYRESLIIIQNENEEFIDYGMVYPIKLTDKVILRIKNSFVAAVNNSKICITAPHGFEFHFDKYGEDYVLSVYCNTGCFVPQKCSHLHEFQNLWFSLCGEELIFFSTEP